MKKRISLILLAVACLSLWGCGQDELPQDSTAINAEDNNEKLTQEEIVLFPEIDAGELLNAEQLQGLMAENLEWQSVYENINFKSFSMETLDGQTMTQDILSNSEMTMIILWSPYSGSSVYELSDLQYVENKIGDKSLFKVVGILEDAYDFAGNKRDDLIAEAKVITEDALVAYPSLVLASGFEVPTDSLPVCLILNNTGDVLYAWNGACDLDELMKIIKSVALAQ